MENFIHYLLYLHISMGAIALVAGPTAIATKKGGLAHRLAGKIFSITMITGSSAALVIAYAHDNIFLFVVGIFSLYLVSTGYRALYLKKVNKGKPVSWIDWLLTSMMGIFVFIFAYLGIRLLLSGNNMGIVLLVFGGIAAEMVVKDARFYLRGISDANYWLTTHIQRMIAGNIAAFTAFLVVNNHQVLPGVVAWLLPTAVGSFLIVYWMRRVKIRIVK